MIQIGIGILAEFFGVTKPNTGGAVATYHIYGF